MNESIGNAIAKSVLEIPKKKCTGLKAKSIGDCQKMENIYFEKWNDLIKERDDLIIKIGDNYLKNNQYEYINEKLKFTQFKMSENSRQMDEIIKLTKSAEIAIKK